MKVADGIQEMAAMQVVKVKNVDLFEFEENSTKAAFFIEIHGYATFAVLLVYN